jgi:hypothetical protein
MAKVYRNGAWVEDDGSEAVPAPLPGEAAPVAEEPESEPKQDIGMLEKLGEAGLIAANSATLGAIPAIAGIFSPETKKTMQDRLGVAKEKAGEGLSMAAEIGGGFLTPIPGLGLLGGAGKAGVGLGKAALAAKLAKAAAHGGIVGGASSGIRYASEAKPGEYDVGQQLGAIGTGAGLGAAMGGAASTLGSALSNRAHATRFSAGGGTAGSIKAMGKSYPAAGLEEVSEHADRIADWAVKNKVIGGFGQGLKSSINKADDLFEQAEKQIENVMRRHENTPVISAKDFKEHIVDTLLKQETHGNIINPTVKSTIENRVGGLIDGTLRKTSKGGYEVSELTPRDIQRVKSAIGTEVYGLIGESSPGAGVASQMLARAKSVASDLEDRMVTALNKNDGQLLKDAKQQYNYSLLWKGMGIKGKISEQGLLEHLMGRGMRGVPNTYAVGQLTGSKNTLLNALIANLVTERIPSTLIATDKAARAVAGQAGKFNALNPRRVTAGLGQLTGSTYADNQSRLED